IPDADAHRGRIRRMLPRTDILKSSTEDLAFLVPGATVPDAAGRLLGWGARCVLITDGPAAIWAFTAGGQLSVPVPPVEVVDTVGAGDSFGGGFLAWWAEHGLTRADLADLGRLRAAVTAGAMVAAVTCSRAGANHPGGTSWTPARAGVAEPEPPQRSGEARHMRPRVTWSSSRVSRASWS